MKKKRALTDKEMGVLISYSDGMIDGIRNGDIEYLTKYEGRITGFLDHLYLQKRFDRVTRDGIFSYYARDRVYGFRTGGKDNA